MQTTPVSPSSMLRASLPLFLGASALGWIFESRAELLRSEARRAASNPRLTTSLEPHEKLPPYTIRRFTVTVEDPDSTSVSLTLLDPPPGLVLAPQRFLTPPATVELEWQVPPIGFGRRTLLFELRDEQSIVRQEVEVRLRGAPTGIFTGDVTGDGVPDAVALAQLADLDGRVDAGAVYVWAGGPVVSESPTATLFLSDAELGGAIGHLQLGDVTGDGVDDIVLGARYLDGTLNAAGILVWEGGPDLLGAREPSVFLRRATPFPTDSLFGFTLIDVTGDGGLDVVAEDWRARTSDSWDRGVVLVWFGGAELLAGGGLPNGELTATGPGDNWQIGYPAGVTFHDVDADGIRDLLVGTQRGEGEGAVLVYLGGRENLAGAPVEPHAVLVPEIGSRTGLTDTREGLRVADVTGDGIPDVLAANPHAWVRGVPHAGAIYVWPGDEPFVGRRESRFTLAAPRAAYLDHLTSTGSRPGFDLVDVTGDGVLDVLTIQGFSVFDGLHEGSVYVFDGGALQASQPGIVAPIARLRHPDPTTRDSLGLGSEDTVGLQYADLNEDGVLDVLVVSPEADREGVVDAGGLELWMGGGGLIGALPAFSRLVPPSPSAGDRLAYVGLRIADVSGDGTLDVVACADGADHAGVADLGVVHVWLGDGGWQPGVLLPDATLLVPDAQAGSRLGATTGEGLQIGDVTGDGIQDVVCAAPRASSSTARSCGAIHVWEGGSRLAGKPAPRATVRLASPRDDDLLTEDTAGQGWFLIDVSGDGVLDIVAGGSSVDVGRQTDAGVVAVVRGGSELKGSVVPDVEFHAPLRRAHDHLGWTGGYQGVPQTRGQAIRFTDLTGDGRIDLLVGATLANVRGIGDAGALYRGRLQAALRGAVALERLSVPGARKWDFLGY